MCLSSKIKINSNDKANIILIKGMQENLKAKLKKLKKK